MLEIHQGLGLSTLALMSLTVILGELNYQDLYTTEGTGTGNYKSPHRYLAYTTAGLFSLTGSFALFAPEVYNVSHSGFDSAIFHKIAVSGAALGMFSQLYLGYTAVNQMDGEARQNRINLHRKIGYATLACLFSAALVWVF